MNNRLVTCPWCGEQMRFDADSVHVWYKCDNCLAISPKARRLWDDSKTNQENWSENKNRALFLIERSNEKSSRWVSVKERLPISDEYVLCWYADENGKKWHTVGKLQDQNGTWNLDVYLDDQDSDFTVTHWMPLPEPPKEDCP